jgi:hypothetical protein
MKGRGLRLAWAGFRLHALDRGQQAEQVLQLDHRRPAARLHGEQPARPVAQLGSLIMGLLSRAAAIADVRRSR